MSYKVIHYFTDLQDFNHPYKVGDIFPRHGMSVSDARLNELASNNNKQGKPLIKKTDEGKDFILDGKTVGQFEEDVIEITEEELVKENTFSKTDINRMSTAELRDVATINGIENASTMTGGELKKILIKHFNL